MTDNKRITNKQLQEQLNKLIKKFNTMDVTIKLDETDLNILAQKTVSRMVKLKSMEDWFSHINKTDASWQPYRELELSEEYEALGEAAKLMTLMDICKQDEEYEKCAIIKDRMEEVNRILRKHNKK